MHRLGALAILVRTSLAAHGCCTPTAREAWDGVITKCAEHDTSDVKEMIYFGPSNSVGLGSVWQRIPEGLDLWFIPTDIDNGDPEKDEGKELMTALQPGTLATC